MNGGTNHTKFAAAPRKQTVSDDMEKWAAETPTSQPIDMVLFCPACGERHIDAPCQDIPGKVLREGVWVEVPCVIKANDANAWTNPPHRSHRCDSCGHIWRPADVPTNGVAAIKTKGKADSPDPEFNTENESQGYAIEAVWQFCPELKPRDDGRVLLTPAQVETCLRRMGWHAPGELRETNGTSA